MDSTSNNSGEFQTQLEMSTQFKPFVPYLTSSFSIRSDNISSTVVLSGLISQTLFNILEKFLQLGFLPQIEVIGVFANTINLYVFWTIGLNDSVSSSFFALSLSDMFYLFTSLYMWICYVLHKFWAQQEIRFSQLSYLGFFYRSMFLVTSVLITTYIAIQRCCCVAFPLKFKGVFTLKRNAVVIILICTFSASIYLPVISNQSYGERTSSWWSSKLRKDILKVIDLLGGTMLPIITQVVTILCMIVLTLSLRKSSKFRQEASSLGRDQSSDCKEVKVSGKELQVVKAVTVVTLMFIICNVPTICIALTRRFVPTFDLFQRHESLFHLTNITRDIMQCLNASLNIVVYYHFNSAYRTTVKRRVFSKFCVNDNMKSAQ